MTNEEVLEAKEAFKLYLPYNICTPEDCNDGQYWEYWLNSMDKYYGIKSKWNRFLELYQKEYLRPEKNFYEEFYKNAERIGLLIMEKDSFWEYTAFKTDLPDWLDGKCLTMTMVKTGRKYLSIDIKNALWQSLELNGIIPNVKQFIIDNTGSELFADSKNFRYAVGQTFYTSFFFFYVDFAQRIYSSENELIKFLKEKEIPFYCLDVDDLLWDITDCDPGTMKKLEKYVRQDYPINGIRTKVSIYTKNTCEFTNGLKCYIKKYSDGTINVYPLSTVYQNDSFFKDYLQIMKLCSGDTITEEDLKYWDPKIKIKSRS